MTSFHAHRSELVPLLHEILTLGNLDERLAAASPLLTFETPEAKAILAIAPELDIEEELKEESRSVVGR